jgi:hypothetical protein
MAFRGGLKSYVFDPRVRQIDAPEGLRVGPRLI